MWTACYYNFNYNSASFLFVVAFSKKTSFVPKVAKSKRWKWRIRCKSFFSFTKPCATKLSPWYIKESSRKHTSTVYFIATSQFHHSSQCTVAKSLIYLFSFLPKTLGKLCLLFYQWNDYQTNHTNLHLHYGQLKAQSTTKEQKCTHHKQNRKVFFCYFIHLILFYIVKS